MSGSQTHMSANLSHFDIDQIVERSGRVFAEMLQHFMNSNPTAHDLDTFNPQSYVFLDKATNEVMIQWEYQDLVSSSPVTIEGEIDDPFS